MSTCAITYVTDEAGFKKTIQGDEVVAITDVNGNTATLGAWWGSEASAISGLKSLKGCRGCIDCVDCIACFHCTNCTDCHHCEDCWCSRDCRYCKKCSSCERCYDCFDSFDNINCRSLVSEINKRDYNPDLVLILKNDE